MIAGSRDGAQARLLACVPDRVIEVLPKSTLLALATTEPLTLVCQLTGDPPRCRWDERDRRRSRRCALRARAYILRAIAGVARGA
jgi:hypothetical protein